MKKSSFVIALIVVLIEVFIFNFSFVKSLFYDETSIDLENIQVYGMKKSSTSDSFYIENKNSYFIFETNNVVNNIYLDISITFENSVNVLIDYIDDANEGFNKFKTDYNREIVKNIEKSKYIDCYHLGNSKIIKVEIDSDISNYLNINNIVINKKVPLFFNFFRTFLIFSIMFVIYNYIKNNRFKRMFDKNYKYILSFVIVIFSLLVCTLYKNTSFISVQHDYYSSEYKEALMNGNVSFSIDEVDDLIIDKDNIKGSAIPNIAFDTSFYNGKFYMYFGILPAILMGITGLSISDIACLFSIIGVIFSSLVIDLIIDRYCKNVSKGLKILLIIYFLFNCRLLLLISFTRFYETLIICGYSLCMVGLYFFLKYHNNSKNIYLFFGSVFLSLALLSRVSMIVVSLFGLYLIYKKLNSKNVCVYIFPYLIIGCILAYLNYIRFGNIFEFGFKYQLGIVDNSYLKFDIITVLNGVFCYLLRLPIINTVFPYVYNNISMIPYNGFYYNTSSGNGILPMSILGIILPFVSKNVNKNIKKMSIVCVCCGLLLLLINNTAGGSVKRYTLEFTWLFLIPMIVYAIAVLKKKKCVLVVLIILSCILNFLVIFDTKNDDVKIEMDNSLYYKMKYF